MNIFAIRDSLKEKGAGRSTLGLNDIYGLKHSRKFRIKKDKIKLGTASIHLYTLQLLLPFNPFDLNDESYNIESPFIIRKSNTTGARALIAEMKSNRELAEFMCSRVGLKVEDLDLDNVDPETVKITKDISGEKSVFWTLFEPYRSLLPYVNTVQQFKYTKFGKFGRKFLSTTKLGDDGLPVGPVDLGYRLYELERALASEQINRICAEYKHGGIKFGKPDTDKSKEIKEVWDKLPVKNPYTIGVLRYITIPTDKEYIVGKETLEKIASGKGKSLQNFEVYGSGSLQEVAILEGYLNKLTDIHFDFLEIGIGYPEVEDDGKTNPQLLAYQRRDVSCNPVRRLHTYCNNLEEYYREFRDDENIFDEAVMLRSVGEFRRASDEVLLSAARDSLDLRQGLITQAIYEEHRDIIQQIDQTLSQNILEGILEDSVAEGDKKLNLTEYVKVTENTPNAGVSVLPDEEDEINVDDVDLDGVNLDDTELK